MPRGGGGPRFRRQSGGHGAEISSGSLRFAPDSKTLASGGLDGFIRLWDVAEGRERAALEAPSIPVPKPARGFRRAKVYALAFAPDGATLATGGDDGAVSLWDPAAPRRLGALDGHPGSCIFHMQFSPDGRTLASSGMDKTVRLWDTASREGRTFLEPPLGDISDLAFSADGHRLATIDGLYSPAERRLAALHRARLVRVWDVASGGSVAKIPASMVQMHGVAFSPDGRWLASSSGDGTVRLWDAATYKEGATLKGHRGTAAGLAFSADGKALASAGQTDHTVRLWKIPTGEPLAVLEGHKGPVWAVAISPDGRTLASAGREGLIRVWDLRPILGADAGPAATPRP